MIDLLRNILCGAERSLLTAHPTMKLQWADVDKLEAKAGRKAPVSETTPIGGASANPHMEKLHVTKVSSLPLNRRRMS